MTRQRRHQGEEGKKAAKSRFSGSFSIEATAADRRGSRRRSCATSNTHTFTSASLALLHLNKDATRLPVKDEVDLDCLFGDLRLSVARSSSCRTRRGAGGRLIHGEVRSLLPLARETSQLTLVRAGTWPVRSKARFFSSRLTCQRSGAPY